MWQIAGFYWPGREPSAGREAKFAGQALPIAETVSYYTELKPGIERYLAMGVATRCGWKFDDVRTMLLMICRLDCLHRLTTSKYESNGIVRSAVGGRCAGGKYMIISSDRLPMQTNYRGTLCEER